MIALLLFMFCDYGIMNRLPQPNYVERDWQWMQSDPNAMESYFRIYEEVEKEPHVHLVLQYWLMYNPLVKHFTGPVRDGRRAVTYSRMIYDDKLDMCVDKEHYEIGNVNGDDVVDMVDFAISAKYFTGGLYKPEPIPEPIEIPIEIKAIILRLLLDG